jgi:hypothetical protein
MPSRFNRLTLLSAATAVNGEPALVTDGDDLGKMRNPNNVLVLVNSSAGSGVMTVTIRMWAYHAITGAWYALGTGADSTLTGIINDGNAIGENGVADNISHAEIISGLRGFSRIYAEITAIGGTATAIGVVVATRDPGNM